MLDYPLTMKPRLILSWSNFFASVPYFATSYIIAPFLALYMPASSTGLVVSLGAIVTLVVFGFMPELVTRYGPQKLAVTFAGLTGIVLLLLGRTLAPLEAVVLVAILSGLFPLITYQLDPMLEACVEDEQTTGRVRTLFLTAGNTALLLSPVIIALLLDHANNYGRVFLVAAMALIPFILLMFVRALPRVRALKLKRFTDAAIGLYADHDLRAVVCCYIVLQFLFQLTPLYVPLYLHTELGMPWNELGWVLAVALIPYILVEYPAGLLADTKVGDKLLLALGFVIAGLAFASVSFIHAGTPIALTILLLIVLRIGSALIESMTETHFFRRVNADNADAVSVFRTMKPVGALVAPIIGTLLLSVAGYSSLFAISGFGILILGLASALAINPITPIGRPRPPAAVSGTLPNTGAP